MNANMTTTGVLLIVLAMMTSSMAYDELTSSRTMTTTTSPNDTTDSDGVCKDGLVLPRWSDDKFLSLGDRISRGLVYFLALCYLFVGVSIVADRFMAAIEVITSQEKEITIKRSNGETQTVVVRIWNETVANLTLMALGSSAPEILLSIIEICGMGFNSGDLGPGTIVGSAAFNLFIIIALCVYVVPSSEVRRVKHLRVFFITATWSVFAYIWLYIILVVTSYGVIELWEALLTLVFFPLTVLTAYIADRRLLIYKYLSKKYRMNARGVIVEGEGGGTSDDDDDQVDVELTVANHVIAIDTGTELKTIAEDDGPFDEHSDEIREFEQHRRDYVIILRDLRKKHPDKDMDTLETMARDEIANRGPKSRAFYRIQATRKLTGGGNVIKRSKERRESGMSSRKQSLMDGDGSLAGHDDNVTRVFFDPGHYTVMENVGEFNVTVSREGGDLSTTIFVDYRTEDGTANAGSDYVYGEGTLVFFPGEIHKQFKLAVIDDDVFEEDEHFYVRLTSARAAATAAADARSSSSTSMAVHANGGHGVAFLQSVDIVEPSLATVMILDDDHGGIFNFVEKECEIAESIGQLTVKVNRFSGARGRVSLPYRTFDGTAKQGRDYEHVDGELVFENNETEKSILVNIIEEDSYEKDVTFFVELLEPKVKDGDIDSGAIVDEDVDTNDMTEEQRIALMGRPKLGDYTKIQVRIKESKEFKNTVDKLIKMANMSVMVGTSSWREQFIEAITVSAEAASKAKGAVIRKKNGATYIYNNGLHVFGLVKTPKNTQICIFYVCALCWFTRHSCLSCKPDCP